MNPTNRTKPGDPMTDQQRKVFEFICESVVTRGFPPSHRDICQRFGWRSSNAAWTVIAALKRRGLITAEKGVARGLRVNVERAA